MRNAAWIAVMLTGFGAGPLAGISAAGSAGPILVAQAPPPAAGIAPSRPHRRGR
jgi:hypothetical protein